MHGGDKIGISTNTATKARSLATLDGPRVPPVSTIYHWIGHAHQMIDSSSTQHSYLASTR
jgi:hypothetical protein